jgi:hypothetical protein
MVTPNMAHVFEITRVHKLLYSKVTADKNPEFQTYER